MVDGQAGMHPLAVEWNRRLRELWIADINAALTRLDAYASKGRLSPKSLPPNTLRDVGDYNPDAVYRKGDVVTGSDGRDYYTTSDGATGLDPASNPGSFRPIQGWNPSHDHGGDPEQGVPLAEANTHEALDSNPATAIHWTREMVQDMIAGGFLVAGDNVTLDYDDTANTLTIASTGGGSEVPPPPDTYVYLVDGDGAYVTDGDGAYLWEPA